MLCDRLTYCCRCFSATLNSCDSFAPAEGNAGADEQAEATEGVGETDPSLAPEPALTVFGRNVPTGGD